MVRRPWPSRSRHALRERVCRGGRTSLDPGAVSYWGHEHCPGIIGRINSRCFGTPQNIPADPSHLLPLRHKILRCAFPARNGLCGVARSGKSTKRPDSSSVVRGRREPFCFPDQRKSRSINTVDSRKGRGTVGANSGRSSRGAIQGLADRGWRAAPQLPIVGTSARPVR